jgi:hypothetical protein
MIETAFPEFGVTSADTKPKVRSWSGLTSKDLASKSRDPLRSRQYELLFTEWSEQVHGSPSAVTANLFLSDASAETVLESDDIRITEVATMSVTFFLHLWREIPDVPDPDAEKMEIWTRRMLNTVSNRGGS